eukprot:gene39963-52750_t
MPWRERSEHLWRAARPPLHELMQENDVVVIEGAGSPAEINLMASDIVNMRIARHAQARCLLATDIDRGGAFAHLYGTWALLPEADRALLQGFVLNKFRGDAALLAPAPQQLQELTGVPTVATLPMWWQHGLPEEDGVFELNSSGSERRVMKCPSKIVCKEWVDAIQNAVQMKRNPNREIIQSRTTSLLQLGRSSLLSRIGRANSNDICSSPGRDQDIIHRKDKDIIPTATTITTPTPIPPSSCLIFASLRSKRRSAEVLISRRLNWEKWVLVTEVVIDDELVLTTGLGHCVVLLQSQMETHSRDGHIFIVDTDTDIDRGSGNSDSNNDTDHVHELVSDEHTDTEKKQHHHLPRPLGPRMQLQIQVRRNGSGNRRSLELSLASHSNTHTHTSQQQLVTVMLSTAVGRTVVFLTATEGWHPWRRLGSAVSMILSLALALLSVIQFVTKYRQVRTV